jgi:hypothetical protein
VWTARPLEALLIERVALAWPQVAYLDVMCAQRAASLSNSRSSNSNDDRTEPRDDWRRDGRELFFMRPGGQVMTVAIKTTRRLEIETPTALFAANLVPTPGWSQYSVTPDGQRFLVMESSRQFFTAAGLASGSRGAQ